MPKHAMYSDRDKEADKEKGKTHPIWRGIGLILIVIVPVISYIAATIIIDNRNSIKWLIIPEDVVAANLADPLLFVKIIYAVIISLLLFFLLAIVTFVLNSLLGPSKYGPYDVKR
jgi:hypothetical protein